MKKIIIFGASGHAEVVADISIKNGYEVVGFLDDNEDITTVLGYPRLGRIDDCVKFKDGCAFAIGIGNNSVRKKIYEKYSDYEYPTLIHPSAYVGPEVKIGKGTIVMPMATVNVCAQVGDFCVINTGSIVEHDCCIGDFCLIAPHATVCGVVNIGNGVWLGAGSVVNQTLSICDGVIVGSGGVVTKDITQAGTYIGVPAHLK